MDTLLSAIEAATPATKGLAVSAETRAYLDMIDPTSALPTKFHHLTEPGSFFEQALSATVDLHQPAFLRDLAKANEQAAKITEMSKPSDFARLAAQVSLQPNMMSLVSGPMDELRKSGLFGAAIIPQSVLRMDALIADYEHRFRLPDGTETTTILGSTLSSAVTRLWESLQPDRSAIHQAMETMRSPWLDTQNEALSATAFTELQGIGYLLANYPTFDNRVAAAIRTDLGDWRDPIVWPPEIFSNPFKRSKFYKDRGFNPTLAGFPVAAFDETMASAGLQVEFPAIDNKEGITRSGRAYARLLQFEISLRKFIERQMSDRFGENWIKDRVPDNLRAQWEERRKKAVEDGKTEWPLIYYADFTDYVTIIVMKQHWIELFKPIFRRQENIRESLQRLYPIRLDTMHARIVTLEDEIFLRSEVTRIMRAINPYLTRK